MNGTSTGEFRVVGVDLAAQSKNTAYCVIRVAGSKACVEALVQDADDDQLLKVFSECARIGIDAPFGWPINFASAVCMHSLSNRWPADSPDVYRPTGSTIEYRDVKYRGTDIHIWTNVFGTTHESKGQRRPLSVVSDLITSVAIRNARLLARAESEYALRVDRSGATGGFVEVYPATALVRWLGKECSNGYKDNKDKHFKKRCCIVQQLLERTGLIVEGDIPGHDCGGDIKKAVKNDDSAAAALVSSHDKLDALVSALIALMVEIDSKRHKGFIEPIPPDKVAAAEHEGWIALPRKCSLTRLGLWIKERQREAGAIA